MFLAVFSILVLTPLGADAPSADEITLTAETVFHDENKKISTAEGSAKIAWATFTGSANRLVFDHKTKTVLAVGNAQISALKAKPSFVAKAELIHVQLNENFEVREVFLLDGIAQLKTGRNLEKTELELTGNHFVLSEDGSWVADDVTLIPCSCINENGTFAVDVKSAHIDTVHQRANVSWPVVKIWHVPIFAFPWLSLPLSKRQTGLLVPKPDYTALNGFSFEQPMYVTLGESADVTLTPGYFFGSAKQNAYGIKGPKLGIEFRYTPSESVSGQVNVGLLYDLNVQRNPLNAATALTQIRGLRNEFSLIHNQNFENGFSVRLNLNQYSDGFWNRDVVPDVIAQNAMYLRSSAVAFQRGNNHLISLDATVRQSLETGHSWLESSPGSTTFAHGQIQRLPMLTASLPKTKLAGPISVEASGELGRLAPLFSLTGDEGASSLGGAIGNETFQSARARSTSFSQMGNGDRVFQMGEREARTRAQVFAKLQFDALVFQKFSVGVFVANRTLATLGEATKTTGIKSYVLADAKISTNIVGQFDAVKHVIEPEINIRAMPLFFQNGTTMPAYDQFDFAASSLNAAIAQGVFHVRQRLVDGSKNTFAMLDVGQLAFAQNGTPVSISDSFLDAKLNFKWLTVSTLARGTIGQSLNRVSAAAAFDDSKGHGLSARYDYLVGEGHALNRRPIDLLFDSAPTFTSFTAGQLLTGEAHYNFGPVAFSYNAIVTQGGMGLFLAQHTLAVTLRPACDCFTAQVSATQRPQINGLLTVPDFAASVSISGFGSLGR
jgi:LPS-assembly protein